jgi:hypothetical protein
LAHAAFWATHGLGFAYAQQRAGIMAKGSPGGIWPTEVDVASVRAFTRGQNVVSRRGLAVDPHERRPSEVEELASKIDGGPRPVAVLRDLLGAVTR